ncbi:tRNA/rRNA methyltransferase (SpoU) family protein [Euphorbia peplus]|nr:tRNA/rRNA methyltransferase (SpoU) family protein [Euphorbia peplus]
MQSTYACCWVYPPSLNPSNLKGILPFRTPNFIIHTQIVLSQNEDDSELNFCLPSPNLKFIASTANPFVKHCVKLHKSSPYRHAHRSVLLVGTTPIREIYKSQEPLEARTVETECLILLDKAQVPKELDNPSTRTLRASALVMKRLSQLQSTESIEAIALMKFPTTYFVAGDHEQDVDCRKWFPAPQRVLVLEGIQDPGNLGTLIRSAVAFRWDGIFLLPGCCDPFNSKALKASRGASFQVPIVSGSWNHLEALKEEFQMRMVAGHPASDDEAKPVSELTKGFVESLGDTPLCLVLGNEGQGLSEKAIAECELLSIPMARNYESLNVAVAGGIFLYMLQSTNYRML